MYLPIAKMTRFFARDPRQTVGDRLPLSLVHPGPQYDDISDTRRKPLLKKIQVIVPRCKEPTVNARRAPMQ
jgi:hypothetical protein